jgi:hypothetical protein
LIELSKDQRSHLLLSESSANRREIKQLTILLETPTSFPGNGVAARCSSLAIKFSQYILQYLTHKLTHFPTPHTSSHFPTLPHTSSHFLTLPHTPLHLTSSHFLTLPHAPLHLTSSHFPTPHTSSLPHTSLFPYTLGPIRSSIFIYFISLTLIYNQKSLSKIQKSGLAHWESG